MSSELFDRIKAKGAFFSYDKNIKPEDVDSLSLIEYSLKYGDFEDIKNVFRQYDTQVVKDVWETRLCSDQRLIRLNLFLARIFFNMDVEAEYFQHVKSSRYEKLKLFASQNKKFTD